MSDWLDEILWDERGLVPAIAQEQGTGGCSCSPT